MTTKQFDTYTNIDEHTDITISVNALDTDWLNYSGIDTTNTITIGNIANPWLPNSTSGAYTSGGYTTDHYKISDIGYSTSATLSQSGQISLIGDNADIDINGVSLKDFMERVESRLGLLSPDSRLEQEWDELRELGDRYRELEKEIHDRMKTFDILKKE